MIFRLVTIGRHKRTERPEPLSPAEIEFKRLSIGAEGLGMAQIQRHREVRSENPFLSILGQLQKLWPNRRNSAYLQYLTYVSLRLLPLFAICGRSYAIVAGWVLARQANMLARLYLLCKQQPLLASLREGFDETSQTITVHNKQEVSRWALFGTLVIIFPSSDGPQPRLMKVPVATRSAYFFC